MNLRVHLTTEAEPAAFHPAIPDGHRVFAIQLALEVSNVGKEDPEEVGKAATEAFLRQLPEAQFLLVTTDDAGEVVKRPVERAFLPPLAEGEAPPNIAAWLHAFFTERNKELQDALSFQDKDITAPLFYVGDDRGTADMRNARALDLMRAAWRWPAPLAQKAGLISAAFVPGPVGERGFLVFVPKEVAGVSVTAPEQLDPNETVLAHKLYRIRVSWEGAEPYEFITRDLAHDTRVLPEVLPERFKRFKEDGHYILPANPEGLQRLLSRIEERAPFLLWAPTVMGTRAAETRHIFRIDPLNNESNFSGKKLHWLARASALSMFDTTIVGLLLPVSNTANTAPARSPVLERLTRVIAGMIEQDPNKDVDEGALYLALHKRLWAGFVGMNPDAVWESIRALLNGAGLPEVRKALTGTAPDDMDEATWTTTLDALSGELGRLAELLESEAGGENWLKARLVAFIDPEIAPDAYVGVKSLASPEQLKDWFNAFLAGIDSDWNASAALRNAFGAQALAAATKELSGASAKAFITASGTITDAVTQSAPLLQRFGLGDKPRLFDALWGPVFAYTAPDGLRDFIEHALDPNLGVLTRDPEDRDVFRPDDRPLPLQLPIADSPDAFGQAGATEFMSGLGFLIHHGPADKAGEFDDEPVHLSLIKLSPHNEMESGDIERTLDPVLPQPAPGSAGLAIPYTGAPLSSPGLAAPGAGGQSDTLAALAERLKEIRPYARGEVAYADADRLPDLAYGFGYRHSAFWVPPSGVLPVALRDRGNPFLPVRPKDAPYKHSDTPWLCQRRTAIAGAGLAIGRSDAQPAYALPPEVHPLSLDVPRIALPSLEGGSLTRDLYRSTGGAGTLGPGETTVILRDVDVAEVFDPGKLRILPMTRSDSDASPEDREALAAQAEISYDHRKRTLTVTIKAQSAFFWLRLYFTDDAPEQVLSFADPQAHMGQDASARSAPPLLIAPSANGDWLLPDHQTVVVTGPRVSFEDLERWAANDVLWCETCGGSASAQDLIAALRAARALFEATGDPYAEKLKALPDPAVTGLMLMLAQTDAAQSYVTPAVQTHTLSHRPYADHGASVPTEQRTEEAIQTLRSLTGQDQRKALEALLKTYRRLVDAIVNKALYSLRVEPGTLAVDAKSVRVDEGCVAQFSVHPLVPKARFGTTVDDKPQPGIFHTRMAELSIGDLGDRLIFAGPALAIEVMTTPCAKTVHGSLLHATLAGRSRTYGIEARVPADLRLFSQAELVTQRWRFARPIYAWIDVAGPVDGRYPSGPVVPVGETKASGDEARSRNPGDEEIEAFEKEAFATRDITDGAYTRVRLRPPGETTALDQIAWPERSATYLRHRIELISRYAGAMREPRKGRVASDGLLDWAARLAILAEPDAAPLGRPQIRALLPLQSRVTENDPAGPTPVTCILSEPPYAQLGLADRIDAELAVKPRFEAPQGGTLQVVDLRKELSPDPLLSYFPVRPGVSRAAVLEAEGPAGLHFDRAQSAAPAWSNAQYLLRVDVAPGDGEATENASADAEELEESFAGVILSRRADPGWSWYAPEAHADTGTMRPRWVELVEGETKLKEETKLNDPTAKDVVTITKDQGVVTVMVRRTAIFEEGGDGPVPLWSGLAQALLLTPLGDRRYRLGIYGPSPGNAKKGTVGGARLLTALTVFTDGAPLTIVQPESAPPSQPACQSPTTLTDWVRSTRDFLHVMQGRAGSEPVRTPVETLHARITGGWLLFRDGSDPARVTTPLALRRYPLHVHRRLVSILLRPSEQIGHRIDLFHGAWLADDWGAVKQSTAQAATGMSLILAELETRAECVLLSGPLPPQPKVDEGYDPAQRYRQAVFDLLSTAADRSAIRQLRFHIRSAGESLPLDKLKMAPKWSGADLVAAGDPGQHAHALDAILFPAKPKGTTMRISGHNTKGEYFEANHDFVIEFPDLVHVDEGGQVSLILKLGPLDPHDPLAEPVEHWADVSMLHSRYKFDANDPDRFDFDWLFGADGSNDTELPRAVAPEVLNRLLEAQARLVGLTDRIPVTRGK